MLKNLPIIPSQTSQNYSHIITYYSFTFLSVILMSTIVMYVCIHAYIYGYLLLWTHL